MLVSVKRLLMFVYTLITFAFLLITIILVFSSILIAAHILKKSFNLVKIIAFKIEKLIKIKPKNKI